MIHLRISSDLPAFLNMDYLNEYLESNKYQQLLCKFLKKNPYN